MQVDTVKPPLKAPGTKRLNQKDDKLLSNSAYKSNLRRYTVDISGWTFVDSSGTGKKDKKKKAKAQATDDDSTEPQEVGPCQILLATSSVCR